MGKPRQRSTRYEYRGGEWRLAEAAPPMTRGEPAPRSVHLAEYENHDSGDRDLYWHRLWPASLGVGAFLVENPEVVAGRQVLELGSGVGFVSIVAALMGGYVTLSDKEAAALDLARHNVRLNGLEAEYTCIDWFQPSPGKWEVVVGCDLCYDVGLVEPLARTIDRNLTSDGVALLADPIRSPFTVLLLRLRDFGFAYVQHSVDVFAEERRQRVGVYIVTRDHNAERLWDWQEGEV